MSIQVEIYGMKYPIKGSSDSGHIEQLAKRVNEQMHKIAKQDPRLDVTRLAVLTAMNLADELVKIQTEYEQLLRLLEEESKG